jgi:hypothetical protein
MTEVIIGIDPHKGSHTAVALDGDEQVLARLRVKASAAQVEQLQRWAGTWPGVASARSRTPALPGGTGDPAPANAAIVMSASASTPSGVAAVQIERHSSSHLVSQLRQSPPRASAVCAVAIVGRHRRPALGTCLHRRCDAARRSGTSLVRKFAWIPDAS